MIYVGNDIHGVKWRNWKMMFKEMDIGDGPVRELSIPRIYNLVIDPKEEHAGDADHAGELLGTLPQWARFYRPRGDFSEGAAHSSWDPDPYVPGTAAATP